MNNHEVNQRIKKLRNLIDHHRYLYHVKDVQEMSEAALDSLKKELFDLEEQFPKLITPDSPTQRVGGVPLKEFKKVAHQTRMLSLNDAFSQQDLQDWQARMFKLLTEQEKNHVDFYCEFKIDGLAIELEYENGIFVRGSTRGDGAIGEDITQNLKTIEAIPLTIDYKKNLTIRGEVFISKKEFAAQNEIQKKKGLPPYANPRNIAAGSVRQLDPKITASRKLDSFAYDIITGIDTKTHKEKHEKLKELGFKTNSQNRYCASLYEVLHFYQHVGKIREKISYEIDGVVVIVDNNALFEKLGIVGKTPRAAIAFKFAQSQATTIIEDIKIQVGRTGALTPVAILKPVQVSGITISRATLHNTDEIKRLDVKIGDTVIVGRAGDVIPDIIKVLPELRTGKERNFVMPRTCPSCNTKLSRLQSNRGSRSAGEKSETGIIWYCPNQKCFARQRRNFYHFVSRPAFDIDGLGPKIIDRLLDYGFISDPADIFQLQAQDLVNVERFAKKSVQNLINSIAQKKEIPLSRFIYALGIRNIGQETALDLARHFYSLQNLTGAKLEDFDAIANIGPIVAQSVHEWFSDKHNKKLLDKFKKVGVKVMSPKKETKGKLSGKIFIFTGSLDSIERELAKEKVRDLGGQISESISKNIDIVVAGAEPGSKLAKAQKLGLKIIGEKEFLGMI